MDKDYRDFNTAKKIRIATAVVLILCAIAASIAWALLVSEISIPGNKLTLGQVNVVVGYYDSNPGSLSYGDAKEYGKANADSSMIDYDEASMSTAEYTANGQRIDYARNKNIEQDWTDEHDESHHFPAMRWGAARDFFVENKSSVDCYYRIYFESIAAKDENGNPVLDESGYPVRPPYMLGDYLNVSIWKIAGRDENGRPYYGTYTDGEGNTQFIYDNTDPRVTPIVNNVPANSFALVQAPEPDASINEWVYASPECIDYGTLDKFSGFLKKAGESGCKQDLHLELTYSDRVNNEMLNKTWNQYWFNICVEAVQEKNQDPASVEFD